MTTELDVEIITLDDSEDECCNLRITAVNGSNGTTATPPRPPSSATRSGGGKDVGGNRPKDKPIVRLAPIPINRAKLKPSGDNKSPVPTASDNNNTLPNVKLASEDVEEILIDSSSEDEEEKETISVKLNEAACLNRTCDSSTSALKKEKEK